MGKRRTQIAGSFIARPRQLIDSPVMRVLGQAAFRALNRIESEHMAHGGAENGKLPVTYADFERAGLYPDAIAPALRELEALGVIETTRKGYGGAAEVRAPSHYRLTYVGAWSAGRSDATGTHEYLKFRTVEDAAKAAKKARRAIDPRVSARSKKYSATPGFRSIPPPDSGGETQNSRPRNPGVHAHPRNPGVLSISREGSTKHTHNPDAPTHDAQMSRRCRRAGSLSLERWRQDVGAGLEPCATPRPLAAGALSFERWRNSPLQSATVASDDMTLTPEDVLPLKANSDGSDSQALDVLLPLVPASALAH